MPERSGRWDLLDRPSDPVAADTVAIDERLTYFRSLSEMLRVEGERLSRIGSGESLRGEYADELRSAATEVAKDLNQTVGRYRAVVSALADYRPALDAALVESASALDDAIDASGARGVADGMLLAAAEPGAQLTPEQVQSNAEKQAATDAASGRLQAAKDRLAGALRRLDEAGQRAASTVREGFDDGLKDSGWDRFKYELMKILKILIKVLEYIGMALAVLAIFIPGLGPIIFAIAAVALVASVALFALGEGSWLEIGIAIAGMVTFGGAKAAWGFAKRLRPTRSSSPQATPANAPAPAPAPAAPPPAAAPTPAPAAAPAPTPAPVRTAAPREEWRGQSKGVPEPKWRVDKRRRDEEAASRGEDVAAKEAADRAKIAEGERLDALELAAEAKKGYRIDQYTGGGYLELNPYLRGLENGTVAKNGDIDKKIAELDARMESTPAVTGPVTTYRGVEGNYATGLRPGDTYSDPAYLSTSSLQSKADDFIAKQGREGTRFRLETEGSGRDVTEHSAQREAEILFRRGEKFDVVSVTQLPNSLPVPGTTRNVDVWEVHLRTPRPAAGASGSGTPQP